MQKKKAVAPLIQFLLHPMSKWHFTKKFKQGVNTAAAFNRVVVWNYRCLCMLLACINFMNLSTAPV